MSGVQKKNENRIAFIAILRWYGAAEKGEGAPNPSDDNLEQFAA